MASKTHPNLPVNHDWTLGDDWKAGMDANFRLLGAVVHLAVKSRTSDEPDSPSNGDRYIHNGGTWSAGSAGDVMARIAGTWYAYTPTDGWTAKVLDEQEWVEYETVAGDWVGVLNNWTATTDPTVDDDETEGYSRNSLWFNTASGDLFRCVDPSDGAAIWVGTTLSLEELGSAATADLASSGGVVPEWETAGTDRKLRPRGASGPVILTPDPLRMAVEAASGGRMTVLYDDNDLPNYMHVVPRFRYEDLGYSSELGTGTATAFLVNGVAKAEILIGAYQASDDGNGNAIVVPGGNPWVNIDYDTSLAKCTAKGAGWHLMTAHEWAAVALWCMANGFEPRGNTDHGRAHDATHEVGVRQDGGSFPPGDSGGTGNILTGSGPDTWRHDGGSNGIADLVGNVWEWQHLLKLNEGEIFAPADNDFTLAEGSWPSTNKWVRNDINAGEPTLAESGSANEGIENVTWASLQTDTGYTPSELLQRLLVEPDGILPQGRFYARDFGERLPLRGGARGNGSDAGLAALNLSNDRGGATGAIGFRPAFVA